MASRRSSSYRSPSPKPGDWERCSVPHGQLVKLQTQGFRPPAYMVPVRAGLATYNGGELSQSLQGRAGMPHPLFGKRGRIPNSSVSSGAPGVLRPPVAQPYTCLHAAYRGIRSPLRVVFGLRGSFRSMEEAVLPCAPFLEGVNISSGRCRSVAYCRDRISVQNPKEDVRN